MSEFDEGIIQEEYIEAVPTEGISAQAVEVKQYTLRPLCAKDVLPMTRIIRKVGLNDIGKAFAPEEIKKMMESVSDDKKAATKDIAESVGVGVVLKIVDIILENLESAETEIFEFFGNISGMTAEDISKLSMDVFFEMIMNTFQSKEFMGFMKVVSKFLK